MEKQNVHNITCIRDVEEPIEVVLQDREFAFRASIKYGLICGAIFIGYFLLMKLFNLEEYYQLRHVNILVLLIATFWTAKKIDDRSQIKLRYLHGLFFCMVLGAIAYSALGVFLFFYLTFFDPALMHYYINHAPMGFYLTPARIALWVASEGIGIQVWFGFIAMEYIKHRQRQRGLPANS